MGLCLFEYVCRQKNLKSGRLVRDCHDLVFCSVFLGSLPLADEHQFAYLVSEVEMQAEGCMLNRIHHSSFYLTLSANKF